MIVSQTRAPCSWYRVPARSGSMVATLPPAAAMECCSQHLPGDRVRGALGTGVAEAQQVQGAAGLGHRGQTGHVAWPLLAVDAVEEPAVQHGLEPAPAPGVTGQPRPPSWLVGCRSWNASSAGIAGPSDKSRLLPPTSTFIVTEVAVTESGTSRSRGRQPTRHVVERAGIEPACRTAFRVTSTSVVPVLLSLPARPGTGLAGSQPRWMSRPAPWRRRPARPLAFTSAPAPATERRVDVRPWPELLLALPLTRRGREQVRRSHVLVSRFYEPGARPAITRPMILSKPVPPHVCAAQPRTAALPAP
jgi:hypothetical protein